MEQNCERSHVEESGPACDRGSVGPLDEYRRDVQRELSRTAMPRYGIVPAAVYCFDVLADAGSRLLSFCGDMAVAFRGYSYYDNGHPFAR